LITAVLKVHEIAAVGSSRITIGGAPVPCGDHAINAIALVINELATNAAKYGSLSAPNGSLSVEWRLEGELVINWIETGAHGVSAPPSQNGFGTTLIARTVERQFRWKCSI
jgi:two-component sensor histidine kinase